MTAQEIAAQTYLRPISGGTVTLEACPARLISEAKEVFSRVCPRFREWITDSGGDSPDTSVSVLEVTAPLSLIEFFSFGECCTQGQVVQFCLQYPSLLSRSGGTFFLLRSGPHLFVADVRVGENGLLEAHSWCPSMELICNPDAGHRLVILST